MPAAAYLHLVGYTFGLAGFATLYWAVRTSLVARGRDLHLKALLPVHFLRYFGLTAMLPGNCTVRNTLSPRTFGRLASSISAVSGR